MQLLIPLLILLLQSIPRAATKEVFVGATPCGQLIRPLLKVGPATDCAFVNWELTLQRDPATQQPATYKLVASTCHVLPDNNASSPDTQSESTGQWRIVKGTGDYAHTMIYELMPVKAGPILRFVKLGNSLLHLLDEQGRYMRGNPLQSYTLNRTTK
jgi:hypothetical protein